MFYIQVADLYCRSSGAAPILHETKLNLPTSDMTVPSQPAILLEVNGGGNLIYFFTFYNKLMNINFFFHLSSSCWFDDDSDSAEASFSRYQSHSRADRSRSS